MSYRRQLVLALKPLRQRLHDQLNALAPGLSAPEGHGRVLSLQTSTGRAVLACAVDFAGRPPAVRSLKARADGRLTDATATFWSTRWKDCLPPPPDAGLRAARLGRDLARFDALREDIAFVEDQIELLLADSAGQILTSLPGVATTRAAAFAAHTLPVERFATPEQLYSATGLAPASYEPSTVRRRGGISRTELPEHRDALIGIAWGLGQFAPAFQQRLSELRDRGKAPLEARVALGAPPALLANASQPTALRRSALRSRQARPRAVTASELCRTTAQPSLPPARARRSARRKRKPAARRRLISLPT